MRASYFGLVKQVEPSTTRPWRIMETVHTSDGLRTRLCAGAFELEEEARTDMSRRQEDANKIPLGAAKG